MDREEGTSRDGIVHHEAVGAKEALRLQRALDAIPVLRGMCGTRVIPDGGAASGYLVVAMPARDPEGQEGEVAKVHRWCERVLDQRGRPWMAWVVGSNDGTSAPQAHVLYATEKEGKVEEGIRHPEEEGGWSPAARIAAALGRTLMEEEGERSPIECVDGTRVRGFDAREDDGSEIVQEVAWPARGRPRPVARWWEGAILDARYDRAVVHSETQWDAGGRRKICTATRVVVEHPEGVLATIGGWGGVLRSWPYRVEATGETEDDATVALYAAMRGDAGWRALQARAEAWAEAWNRYGEESGR